MPSWFASLLNPLLQILSTLGVPEESGPIVALILLYLFVTLLIISLLFLIWRVSRRGRAEAVRQPEPKQDGTAAVSAEDESPVTPVPVVQPVAVGSLHSGLRKTAASLIGRLEGVFGGRHTLRSEQLEELEEILITADFGMATTQTLVAALEKRFAGTDAESSAIYQVLQEEICLLLQAANPPSVTQLVTPEVIMVVGVNGVGKTTTIGKLASRFVREGQKVLLAAGDTFRAAAAEQLSVWAERSGAGIVRHDDGGDPAAVAFDAVQAAVARKVDLLIVDTAGRLHTKTNLMEELKKVQRVLDRAVPGAPHRTLLVVDATTGQNALVQARLFNEAVGVDGIVLTKLDGTARGGIAVAIAAELKIPVCFVGVGEGVEDLRPFNAEVFAEALFSADEAA
jgi:fused signal recognition particle receptor